MVCEMRAATPYATPMKLPIRAAIRAMKPIIAAVSRMSASTVKSMAVNCVPPIVTLGWERCFSAIHMAARALVTRRRFRFLYSVE